MAMPPEAGPKDIVVRVETAGIWGSDVSYITAAYMKPIEVPVEAC